jgi:hypothetical protein
MDTNVISLTHPKVPNSSLLPLAIMLAIRLVPPDVMAAHRAAAIRTEGRPVSRTGAAVVVALWLLSAGLLLWWLWPIAT